MTFRALCSTDDGRLTKGKIYLGGFVSVIGGLLTSTGLRIVVWDDLNQWMTFDPKVFVPVEDGQ